jgi:hypothetical protein
VAVPVRRPVDRSALARPLEGGGQGEGRTRQPPDAGDVPPTVVSLLAALLPVVEGRLREMSQKVDFNQY